MFYYHRIELSKEIDVNKISKLKECDIYHYCYFFQIRG